MQRHIYIHVSDAWEESKHPRAANGQFGSGSGNAKSGVQVDTKALAKSLEKDGFDVSGEGVSGHPQIPDDPNAVWFEGSNEFGKASQILIANSGWYAVDTSTDPEKILGRGVSQNELTDFINKSKN